MTLLITILSFGDFWWSLSNLVFITSLWIEFCDKQWCQIVRLIIQFSAMSTIVTTCCMATLGLMALYYPHVSNRRALSVVFICLIFIIPVIQNSFLALSSEPFDYFASGWCLPEKTFHNFGWFLPIFIFFVYIVVSLTLLVINYYCFFYRSKTDGGVSAFGFLVKKVAARIFVFIFVWGVDLGAFIFGGDFLKRHHNHFLWYLIEISVNSSGLLNFLIYGLDNKEIRKHYSLLDGIALFAISPFYLIGVTFYFFYQIFFSPAADRSFLIDGEIENSYVSGSISSISRLDDKGLIGSAVYSSIEFNQRDGEKSTVRERSKGESINS
jgi:hypothetical protein